MAIFSSLKNFKPARRLRLAWLLPAALLGLLTLCFTANMDLVVCQEDAGPGYLSLAIGRHCLEDQQETTQDGDGPNTLSPLAHPEGCVEFHLALTDQGDNQHPKATQWPMVAAGFLTGLLPPQGHFLRPPAHRPLATADNLSPSPFLQTLLSLATVLLRR